MVKLKVVSKSDRLKWLYNFTESSDKDSENEMLELKENPKLVVIIS